MSWNLASLQNLWTAVALGKRQTVARALEAGPVLLQETRWTGPQAAQLEQALHGAVMTHSPAEDTGGGGSTGGVAVIMPTYLGWEVLEHWNLAPGAVLAVKARLGSCLVVFWSVYLRPGAPGAILERLAMAVPVTHPALDVERQVVLGGFNFAQADTSEAATLWDDLREKWGLVELPQRQKGAYRVIDRGFIRDPAWEAGALRYHIRAPPRQEAVTHTCVQVQLLQIPPNRQPPAGKRHLAIPTAALRPSVFQRELQQRLMRCPKHLPGAHRLKYLRPSLGPGSWQRSLT